MKAVIDVPAAFLAVPLVIFGGLLAVILALAL